MASTMPPADPTKDQRPINDDPNNETTEDSPSTVTPAFQMKDVSTVVNDHQSSSSRRSPSPGIITSRRGRSRSPVASSSSRPNSRAFRSSSAGTSASNVDGDISEAAIAAGAAAIAAKRGPSPFVDYASSRMSNRSPSPSRFPSSSRGRIDREASSSPDGRHNGRSYDARYYEDMNTVNQWPSASFECSPIQCNLSLGSFDWANGVGVAGDDNTRSERYRRHNDDESRYPTEEMGDEHGRHQRHNRYNHPSPERRSYDPYYQEEAIRYQHRHHHRDDYRYYDGDRRYYDTRYDRHYSDRKHSSSSRYHPRHHRENHPSYRKESSSCSRRTASTSQPLYSEHHILSTSTFEEDPHWYHGRRTSQSFRDAPTPTADNSRNTKGSVFRGVKDGVGANNVVTAALRDVESPTVAVVKDATAKNDKKAKKKGKRATNAGGAKKKKKEEAAALPKELLLEADDNSPTQSNPPSAPSPTNIDKELSAIGIDNLDVMLPSEDYLGNLSFRKSYDLEQMFSFMKSPKGSMKEDAFKFGSMSFTNSFLMSASGEEKEDVLLPALNKNELKMRSTAASSAATSHRRHPSYTPLRRSSRSSPLFQGGIPTIHTLSSQSMGTLTPIHSFSENDPIVPLTSQDGMALTAMFAASPTNVPAVGGGGEEDNAGPISNGVVQNQGPNTADGYNEYPVYRDHRAHASSRGGSQPPQANNSIPPQGPMPATLGPNKRIKMLSMGPHTLPTMDLSKRADLYILLKRLAPAFAGFQFKLPEVDLPSGSYESNYLPTDQQLTIAKRRVNSSLCVFGGSVPRRTVSFEADAELTPGQKREKDEKAAYEKDLSSRYFLKEHCISWDVEVHDVIVQDRKSLNSKGKDSMKYCAPVTPSTPNNHNLNNVVLGIREKGKKVKYRCKLCGQPKQNHTCPYQSTVMRSIGTMVYPVVNAFVSDEPGKLAPPLSEMNNFTTLLSQDMSVNTQNYHRPYSNGFNVLTPDSHWSPNTPGAMSAISTPSTPGNRKRDHLLMSRTMSGVSTSGGCAIDDSLFRGIMELKPEQYRRVRFKDDPTKQEDAYRYTHIPTPYSQRKEMGDTLFALSREVPKLADSCAAILRSARENDCWDQAVAELTTQVLIVLKCEEQDYALEGLKRHLLTLGIAC
jgi:hypothetical protein